MCSSLITSWTSYSHTHAHTHTHSHTHHVQVHRINKAAASIAKQAAKDVQEVIKLLHIQYNY